MYFIRALVRDPATPAAVLSALADHVVHAELKGDLLTHPNLPADHNIRCGPVTQGQLLTAMRSMHLSAPARAVLLRTVGLPRALEYLAQSPTATPQDVREVVTLAAGAGPRMSRRVARQVVEHCAAPPEVTLDALSVLLRTSNVRKADRGALITAATHHPDALRTLAASTADHDVAQELTRYAATSDPYRTRVADVLNLAERTATVGGWLDALAATTDPDVVVAAARAGELLQPRDAILIAIADSRRLPLDAVRQALLVRFTQPGRAMTTGRLSGAMSAHLRTGPLDFVRAVAAQSATYWELSGTDERTDFDTSTLDALWDATCERSRPTGPYLYPLVRRADQGAQLALHPAASAALRASVTTVVVDYGCSAAADRVRWFSPSAALRALDDVEHLGVAGAGARVKLPAMRSQRAGLSQARSWAGMAGMAVRERHDLLAQPRAAQALVSLAPTFPGTVGELLATVEALTR